MKTAIAILTLTFLTSSCKDNGKSVVPDNKQLIEQDSLTNTQTKKSRPTIDLIHETENLKLYGDTTIDKDKISYASIKFEPYIGFDDFQVKAVDNKKYATLDLKSNKYANNFRTRLREAYSVDTTNFAGHYSLVYWGCGSACQAGLLIDRKSGKIYDAPTASQGYLFKPDSRMLLINLPDTSGFYDDCIYCKPEIYVLDEVTKKFNKRKSQL